MRWLRAPLARTFAAVAAALMLGTAIGLVALWPSGDDPESVAGGATPNAVDAEVVAVQAVPCRAPQARDCRRVGIEIREGALEGTRSTFAVGDGGPAPDFAVGDRIRVAENRLPDDAPPGTRPPPERFAFVDFERRAPLVWLALIFAVAVIAFGRLRGALSLVGLAGSLAVIVFFVAPAILEGAEPVLVAVVGALAVMWVTLSLAHGVGPKSLAAALGTALSLLLTVLLALAFTELAHITGFASEESTVLQVGDPSLSLEGLVVAGMVIGALGVLDDVTVSQASAVMALRRARPGQGFGELYRRALAVGRDHVAATVNTLVLAYVGASLPILLIFSVGDTRFTEAVNMEPVAQEIVAMLVGSIGIVAAVPLTTALAAVLARGLDPADLGEEEHAHAH